MVWKVIIIQEVRHWSRETQVSYKGLVLKDCPWCLVHCYKNYSPLQLVGTKHHGFHTLVGPKSKHFGFQYKLMGEGYDVLKVHNRVITGAKSLNLLSTSWNCSKELEVASLEAWLVVQTIWYLGKSNRLILPIKKMTLRPKCLYLRPKIQYKTSWIPDSGWT